ncbi:hypothetical protein ACLOJK_011542 [Asimina triloba]
MANLYYDIDYAFYDLGILSSGYSLTDTKIIEGREVPRTVEVFVREMERLRDGTARMFCVHPFTDSYTTEQHKDQQRSLSLSLSIEMRTIPLGASSSLPTSHITYGSSFGSSYSSLHFSNSFPSSAPAPRLRASTSPSTAASASASRSGGQILVVLLAVVFWSHPCHLLGFTALIGPLLIINVICCLSGRSIIGTFQRASQTLEFFPSVQPEVVVREARFEDCWDVAETHCSSFFPNYSFPLDLALRINRLVGLLSGFSVPDGCMRTCLVAVIGNSSYDNFLGIEGFKVGGFEGKGSVTGILTIDTVADFLPRKGPLRQRRWPIHYRKGIAYISNVAVRQRDRRKGISKKLVAKAERVARSWGCRAIALHCDASNQAAMRLYLGQGFRCVKVPDHANWPHPKTSPGIQFNFMMKLLTSSTATTMI